MEKCANSIQTASEIRREIVGHEASAVTIPKPCHCNVLCGQWGNADQDPITKKIWKENIRGKKKPDLAHCPNYQTC